MAHRKYDHPARWSTEAPRLRSSRRPAGGGRQWRWLGKPDARRAKRPDGFARSPWPIELHVGDRPNLEWLDDDFYEVPYGALLPGEGGNLIAAGRCLPAEHEALASAQFTAQCLSYGQAAGLAAALSLRSGRPLRELPGAGLGD
jgi:hypothetical protein